MAMEIGQIVEAEYRTGKYIGELIEFTKTKAVVKILAVLKHPTQGDLHNPYMADVPFFHQRKALAFQEKALIPKELLQKYDLEIPNYHDSLRKSIELELIELTAINNAWSKKAIEQLEALLSEYFSS